MCGATRADNRSVMTRDELTTLLPFATPRQAEVLTALAAHPNSEAAAKALGVSASMVRKMACHVRKKAAAKDPALHTHAAPEGYHLRGASTLVRGDGKTVLQWVKTAKTWEDPAAWAQALEAAIEACEITPRAPAPTPVIDAADLCNVLPIGDPHFGMLAWAQEAGADWDLKIAAAIHRKAIERLLTKAPAAAQALIVWMGDQAHANDQSNATPTSKHRLDTDSRWERMLDVLFAAMINSVNVALLRHARVIVRVIKGNHDPEVAASLALALAAYYRNEPRVHVERAPTPVFVTTWGRVLLAFAHGHAPDPARVQDILAADYRKEMGETEQGYLYTGHKHSKILSERGGLVMEAVQTLAAKDAYATHAGYRSGRGLFVDTYHKRYLVATDRASVAAQDMGG